MKTAVKIGGRPGMKRGFTLIEILVVVAIIIILIGAVIAVGANVRTSSMIRTTQGALQNLEQAAAQWRLETGTDLPDSTDAPGADIADTKIYTKLMSVPNCRKIVQKLNPALIDDNGKFILDSWGNPIRFKAAGANGAAPLRGFFYSRGPDGNSGNTDDIRSVDASK